MNFKEEILNYENIESDNSYIFKIGDVPVLLSAPHTIEQEKVNGEIKLAEPFTKAITLYISNKLNVSYIIRTNNIGLEPNSDIIDDYKKKMIDIINKNNIKLVLDIHGAKREREFDIELGTMNNLSADYSTIKELKEAFIESGVSKVLENEPFKGGGITKTLFFETNVDVIQIEINQKYRDINSIDDIEKICECIINFINQYINK